MQYEPVKTIIAELLLKMAVAVDDIVVEEREARPLFHIKTKDSGALIGVGGEHLRALNLIVRKIVERRANTEEAGPFLIDVNDYHGRRIAELKASARLLAERARTFKYDVEMSPMNAYERMIVHAAFADDRDIVTESSGEGKFRHIVLKYKTPNNSFTA